MKSFKSLAFVSAFLFITLYGCAVALEANWKTIPETYLPPEKAWTIVVSTVSEFFDLETIDGQSGYLKSGWKTTDKCWGGIALGGMVPCERSRVIARVEERTPFKVKIKVEKEIGDPWSNYTSWIPNGNNEKMQNEIMETLSGRLKKM